MRPDCNATPSRIESGEDPLIEKRMSVSFSRPASSFHGSEVVSAATVSAGVSGLPSTMAISPPVSSAEAMSASRSPKSTRFVRNKNASRRALRSKAEAVSL